MTFPSSAIIEPAGETSLHYLVYHLHPFLQYCTSIFTVNGPMANHPQWPGNVSWLTNEHDVHVLTSSRRPTGGGSHTCALKWIKMKWIDWILSKFYCPMKSKGGNSRKQLKFNPPQVPFKSYESTKQPGECHPSQWQVLNTPPCSSIKINHSWSRCSELHSCCFLKFKTHGQTPFPFPRRSRLLSRKSKLNTQRATLLCSPSPFFHATTRKTSDPVEFERAKWQADSSTGGPSH